MEKIEKKMQVWIPIHYLFLSSFKYYCKCEYIQNKRNKIKV